MPAQEKKYVGVYVGRAKTMTSFKAKMKPALLIVAHPPLIRRRMPLFLALHQNRCRVDALALPGQKDAIRIQIPHDWEEGNDET